MVEPAPTAGPGSPRTLELRLALGDGRVAAVDIRSNRPAGIGRLLRGRTPAEALALVPLLFSLCGVAQRAAALGALTAAGALPDDPAATRRLGRAVLAERIEARAWTLCLVWPPALGRGPRPDLLAAVRKAVADLRDQPSDASLHAAELAVGDVVTTLSDMRAGPPSDVGPIVVTTGPGAGWFADRFAACPDFSARPTLDGKPMEVGALPRFRDHPRVAALLRAGAAIDARLEAQLLDLTALPALLAEGAGAHLDLSGDGRSWGCAVVETSRGPLAHRVELQDGRIADWRMVAPTDWNFHPDGPLKTELLGRPARDPEALRREAGLCVAGLDPCVPCTVTVTEVAHA